MANLHKAHPENSPGSLFVDTTCIDCGTCFFLGKNIFTEFDGSQSVVKSQPQSSEQWQEAKRAMLSCPTSSIRVKDAPAIFRELPSGLPYELAPDLYYCGYSAENSYGALSYLIKSPEGNILVDSPRWNKALALEIEKMGGIKYMFLSHKDDVADHEKYHEYFGCQRIVHEKERITGEIIIEGDADFDLNSKCKVLVVPGHTSGHINLLYNNQYLFTGDHLFYDEEQDRVYASKSFCWYSWDKQVQSLQKLLKYNFEWILPGHSVWFHSNLAKEKLKEFLKRLPA